MEEPSLDDLREELARLETREAMVSAQRRLLHDKIDFGYATEGTRSREREVSDERRKLHHRINELRELIRMRERV
jgi:hypothetical protein